MKKIITVLFLLLSSCRSDFIYQSTISNHIPGTDSLFIQTLKLDQTNFFISNQISYNGNMSFIDKQTISNFIASKSIIEGTYQESKDFSLILRNKNIPKEGYDTLFILFPNKNNRWDYSSGEWRELSTNTQYLIVKQEKDKIKTIYVSPTSIPQQYSIRIPLSNIEEQEGQAFFSYKKTKDNL